jgi:hypothetical protein
MRVRMLPRDAGSIPRRADATISFPTRGSIANGTAPESSVRGLLQP